MMNLTKSLKKYAMNTLTLFTFLISSSYALPPVLPTATPAFMIKKSNHLAQNNPEEVQIVAPIHSVEGAKEVKAKGVKKAKIGDNETSKKDMTNVHSTIHSTADDPTSKVFLFTHSLPSPLNLAKNTYTLGTKASLGLTDFIEISTNLFRDINRKFNVEAKMPIIEAPFFLAAIFVDFQNFNYHHHASSNPDIGITSWMPGVVTGFELVNDSVIYVGGNLNFTNRSVPKNIETSGLAYGNRLNVDWSWMYNDAGGKLALNTLSFGATYDLTYKLIGVGVTHHWETFDLGVHYTLNADRQNWLPIVNFISSF